MEANTASLPSTWNVWIKFQSSGFDLAWAEEGEAENERCLPPSLSLPFKLKKKLERTCQENSVFSLVEPNIEEQAKPTRTWNLQEGEMRSVCYQKLQANHAATTENT